MNAHLRHLALLPLLSALAPAALAGGGANGLTDRVLFLPGGGQLANGVELTDLTPDGRYAVVASAAALVPEDTNGLADVYRVDLETGEVRLASTSFGGLLGNGSSEVGSISHDGRFVAFQSLASNLVGLDANGTWDVLRKDLLTGNLVRVSSVPGGIVAANGASASPDLSADGRYVAFHSYATNLDAGVVAGAAHVYRRDLDTWAILRLSHGVLGEPNGNSFEASISDDGSRIAYQSLATNLVWGDTNGATDVFVQDVGASPALVSKPQGGGLGNGISYQPALSGDGQYVAFSSASSNLAAGDGNGLTDVFRVTLATGEVRLVSALPDGTTGASMSVLDDISTDGRYVAFRSPLGELTGTALAHWGMHVRDVATGATWLASRPSGATKLPNGSSYQGRVRADGSRMVFVSEASNLDQGDTNGVLDLFERTLFADPSVYCVTGTTSAGCQPQVAAVGLPSAGADAGFAVSATSVPNNQIGVFLYSFQGKAFTPILGGTLCIGPIAGRSPGLFSGGNPGTSDCSGSYTLDLNAYAAGALGGTPNPELSLVGQQVNGQFWGRDPASPAGFFFSEAVEYVVGL